MPYISLNVDVTKLQKQKFVKGKKGTYADLILIETPNSEYGDYLVKQKGDRDEKMPILGNGKIFKTKSEKTGKQNGGNDNDDSENPILNLMAFCRGTGGLLERKTAEAMQETCENCEQLKAKLKAAVEALKAVRANLAGANKNDSRIAYIDTVLTKLLDAATDERDQLREQLAATTARELHNYDVAKLCREQLAAVVEVLWQVRQWHDSETHTGQFIDAALAKLGHGK